MNAPGSSGGDSSQPWRIAVTCLRVLRFYVSICYTVSWSLLILVLPSLQWSDPNQRAVLLFNVVAPPFMPLVVGFQALAGGVIAIVEPVSVIPVVLFILTAGLMRKKRISWWLIIPAFIPCVAIAAMILHVAGWKPKPLGPL